MKERKMQDFTQSIQGCGKLKHNFISDLTKKERIISSGKTMPGASKYELLCVIYFSQIADKSGFIEQFAIRDLSDILCCSKREVYCLLNGLLKKEYITAKYYQNENWSGIKNIRLIGNDFSQIKKYTGKDRYISAFYPVFDFSDKEMVKRLADLSLFALRLLLQLLCMYDKNHGIRVSFQALMELLDVHDKKLIHSYLKELEKILGQRFFIITGRGRNNYHMIHIRPNPYMTPELTDRQLTYYKRRWMLKIKNESIYVDSGRTILEYLNVIFQQIYTALRDGILLDKAEDVILSWIKKNGYYLDIITLARAGNDLDGLKAVT